MAWDPSHTMFRLKELSRGSQKCKNLYKKQYTYERVSLWKQERSVLSVWATIVTVERMLGIREDLWLYMKINLCFFLNING